MSFLSNTSAIKVKGAYVNGLLDCSGNVLLRAGNVIIGNLDYPNFNINNKSLHVNGGTTFNGNVTINSSTTTSSFLSISSQTGNSIAIGRGAVANGGNSIAIGNVALINGFTNSVAIGAGASCTTNNQIRLGSSTTISVRLGANGSDSNFTFYPGTGYMDIHRQSTVGTDGIIDVFSNWTTVNNNIFRLSSNGSITIAGPIIVGASGTATQVVSYFYNEIRISAQNTAGIPYFRLLEESNGAFGIYNSGNVGVYLGVGATSWGAGSDRRIKKNITDISNSLQGILNIKPVNYNLKIDDESQRLRIGFIAQNVQEYFPLVISETIDEKYETPILGIAYTELIPYMVKAMQEQQTMIQSLEARLSALENKI